MIALGGLIFLPKPLALAAAAPIYFVGTYLPLLIKESEQAALAREIDTALPDFADLLTLLVEAGVDIGRALAIATGEAQGPLGDRLGAAMTAIQLGATRQEALQSAAEECPSVEFRGFAGLFAEADRYGTPIAGPLSDFADDARDKELCRVREEAQKLPVKLLFPLVFLILPAFLLLTAGPMLVTML